MAVMHCFMPAFTQKQLSIGLWHRAVVCKIQNITCLPTACVGSKKLVTACVMFPDIITVVFMWEVPLHVPLCKELTTMPWAFCLCRNKGQLWRWLILNSFENLLNSLPRQAQWSYLTNTDLLLRMTLSGTSETNVNMFSHLVFGTGYHACKLL